MSFNKRRETEIQFAATKKISRRIEWKETKKKLSILNLMTLGKIYSSKQNYARKKDCTQHRKKIYCERKNERQQLRATLFLSSFDLTT